METIIETTLGSLLREQAAKNGERECIVFPNQGIRCTFAGVDKQADEIAKGLLAAGFQKGDHIGIWAYNVPAWAPVFYAAARLGIVTVPINVNCKAAEIEFLLRHADINGLFIIDRFRDADFVEILYQLIPELKTAEAGGLASAAFPHLKMVTTLDTKPRTGLYTLESLKQKGSQTDGSALAQAEARVANTDVLCIMYTSGTTGTPKGVMLTHRNIINNSYFGNQPGVMNEKMIILNPLPFFYISAFTGGLVESLTYGFKMVVLENFDVIRYLEVIQSEACTWIYGVPTMYTALLNHPQFDQFNTKTVQYASIGGAVCPPDLMKAVINKLNLKGLHLAYGLTETSPFITLVIIENSSDPRLDTVGAPISGVEVSIRDQSNHECPVNTQGEICARGHNVMKGYYKMEEASRQAIDAEGWLHTGDLGHLLPNGCLVIDGRIKEMIIRGGEKVYPREIESLLLSMPGIQDAQVAGIPSEKYGEEVGAFIILKAGESISEKDVMDFCKEKISFYKTPRYVFFVKSFPLSANGKVQKIKLSELGLQAIRETTDAV